jgi:signal transduction histidine kinase
MWRTVASSRSLGFVVSVTETELNVMGDKTALQQLLNILLDNAVKYTPPPGQISLLLDERGDQAVIRVADTGIGIASEDQGKIFERFYRADKARSRDFGGAGLGLAIALWIVQQHNGSIAVESTPGKGSVFEVQLPVWREAKSASGRQVQDQNYHPTALRRR